MDPFNKSYRYCDYFVKCSNKAHFLENVIIGRFGLIMDERFCKIETEANAMFDFWCAFRTLDWKPVQYVPQDLLKSLHNPLIQLPLGNYLHAISFLDSLQYGHIFDHLQGFRFVDTNDAVVLSNSDLRVSQFWKHLEVFGLDKYLLLDTVHYNYFVPHLIVPPMPMIPALFHPLLAPWMQGKYLEQASPDNIPRKLYLSRSGQVSRNVINDREVSKFLGERGFTTVTGREPLMDQVRLFHSATFVVGYMGAGLKNMLFCKNHPKVLNIGLAALQHDDSFDQNAKVLGLDYSRVDVNTVDEKNNTIIDLDWLNRQIGE